jgi:hypothetical protein
MKLYIEPSKAPAGGWSLRWGGDSQQLGNFPTVESAERGAGVFAGPVEIVKPIAAPAVLAVLPQGSVESHLRAVGMEPIEDRTAPLFPALAAHS